MTTTEEPAETEQDRTTTPPIMYVEWCGNRFGPYTSMEALHRDFDIIE